MTRDFPRVPVSFPGFYEMDKTFTVAPGQPNSPLLKEVDEIEMLFTTLLTVHYEHLSSQANRSKLF